MAARPCEARPSGHLIPTAPRKMPHRIILTLWHVALRRCLADRREGATDGPTTLCPHWACNSCRGCAKVRYTFGSKRKRPSIAKGI